jgi:hypothetical protein
VTRVWSDPAAFLDDIMPWEIMEVTRAVLAVRSEYGFFYDPVALGWAPAP